MNKASTMQDVVTVTLNPAIDRTITISNFTAGSVNRVELDRSNPGGKGVNVAVALADFGINVAVTGFLGRDNGSGFDQLFLKKKIANFFVRINGFTRVGIKIADPARKQTTDINFPGPTISPLDLEAFTSEINTLNASWFVLSGSVPPGVSDSIYRDITLSVKKRGYKVLLDASGTPLERGLESVPDIVKPNIHELESLVGSKLDSREKIIQAARALTGRGIGMVAVSMGSDGALFVTERGTVVASPPNVDVVSTVGAGDAMVAGILAAQVADMSLADTARLASAFSGDTLSRLEPGLSSPANVRALMRTISAQS